MKHIVRLLAILTLALFVVACGSTESSEIAADSASESSASVVQVDNEEEAAEEGEDSAESEPEPEPTEAEETTPVTTLTDDFDDALSVQAQLAVGTIQLEDTELAVDEATAAQILPLWQAVQALGQSETTAEAEVNAVLKQIQNTMTAEQIAEIAGMQLTTTRFQEMLEAGEITFGRNRPGGAGGEGGAGPPQGGRAGGGFGGGAFGGGGGQGGGIPGQGRPQGGAQGGAQGGGAEGDGAPDVAVAAANGMSRAVVTLLQQKTGDTPVRAAAADNPNTIARNVVAEATGLTAEEVGTKQRDGMTPSEIIEEAGGDVAAVEALLLEALAETPIGESEEFEQLVKNYLSGADGN